MLWVKLSHQSLPVKVQDIVPMHESSERDTNPFWRNRHDWTSLKEVQGIARYLVAMTGKVYVGTDSGPTVSPRFDVIQVPSVGDLVSYTFNGDSSPDGEVVKVSPKLMVTTSTGATYRRRGETGVWMKPGGTWSLMNGHVEERNPHV